MKKPRTPRRTPLCFTPRALANVTMSADCLLAGYRYRTRNARTEITLHKTDPSLIVVRMRRLLTTKKERAYTATQPDTFTRSCRRNILYTTLVVRAEVLAALVDFAGHVVPARQLSVHRVPVHRATPQQQQPPP